MIRSNWQPGQTGHVAEHNELARRVRNARDYASVQAAVDDCPVYGSVEIPAGRYPESITITKPLTLAGAGMGTLIEGAVTVDGRAETPVINGLSIRDLMICAGAGVDALSLTWVFRSSFKNIYVSRCGGSGIRLAGSILNTFTHCVVSTNLPGANWQPGGWTKETTPACGVRGDSLTIGDHKMDICANTFIDLICEGCGTGVWLDASSCGNVFAGGCIEGNGVGVWLSDYCRNNGFYGTYLEQNKDGHFAGPGYPFENAFIGCHTSTDGIVSTINYQHRLEMQYGPSLAGIVDGSLSIDAPSDLVYLNPGHATALMLGGPMVTRLAKDQYWKLEGAAEQNLLSIYEGNGDWSMTGNMHFEAGRGPVVVGENGANYRLTVDTTGAVRAVRV